MLSCQVKISNMVSHNQLITVTTWDSGNCSLVIVHIYKRVHFSGITLLFPHKVHHDSVCTAVSRVIYGANKPGVAESIQV